MANGNGNGSTWLNAYRALLMFCATIIIGMVGAFWSWTVSQMKSVDDKLGTVSLLVAGQAVQLNGLESRVTNTENRLDGMDVRVNESASRIRVLESTN